MIGEGPVLPGQNAFLVPLPFVATDSGEVSAFIGGITPWGAPLVSGMTGRASDGEPWLAIIGESPIGWLRVSKPMTKQEKELFHVRRLATDCRLATGLEMFQAIEPVITGEDPPDVWELGGEEKIGWELTQLTVQGRREAHTLFDRVRERLFLLQRHRIGHLSGYILHMWFGKASDPASLPFRRTRTADLDALIEEVAAYRPDPSAYQVAGGELPGRFDVRPVRAPQEASFYGVPIIGSAPSSPLFTVTGLELQLAFQTEHRASEEWEKLLRRIAKKDDSGRSNVLLISVGAPDVTGRCYLAEETLASFLLDHPKPVHCSNLKKVILHFWSSGRAVALTPDGPQEIWPAIYEGLQVTHHPMVHVAG